MKNGFITIIFALLPSIAMAQIDIEVKELMQFMLPNHDVPKTIKITVRNNSRKAKLVFFRNNYDITGYEAVDIPFRNPLSMLGEQFVSNESRYFLPLVFFANWFKILEPDQQFTFYFQSNSDIDVDRLLRLMRTIDSCQSSFEKSLDWKEDEIVIYLPLRESSAEDNTTP